MASPHERDRAEPTRHVMVRLGSRAFGIPVGVVAEMVQLGKLTPLPDSPGNLRGVMLVRGESVAVHDLRGLLGMSPRPQEVAEMQAMFQAREEDHRRWLAELERSVTEARPFTLATDPHKCAFGKWYDSYKTSNILLESHLRKFDAPHRRIHALAVEVSGLVEAGDASKAMKRIEETRVGDLSEMIRLFGQLRELLASTSTEIALVLRGEPGRPRYAYTVDNIESVQDLRPVSSEEAGLAHGALGGNCAFYGPSKEIAVLLRPEELADPARSNAA